MTNIALVVLDTLRKDAFDRHFDWLPGRRFEHAFSTANWTVPAHASLFTGRYASEAGVHAKNMYFDCNGSVLAEQLTENGYTTRAFSANTNITGHFDFDRGFTDFKTPEGFEHLVDGDLFDWREFSRGTTSTGVRKYLEGIHNCITSDAKTIASLVTGLKIALNTQSEVEYGGTLEAIDELRDTTFSDKEFLFINVMEAHEPYRVPSEYMTVEEPGMTDAIGDVVVGSTNGEQTKQAYSDCANYLSDIYQELFEMLDEEFEYIITLSDHGEMLGEHDAWGHEHGVHEELTHVPLCISGDGLNGRCNETVNLCDVYETILDIAGIERTEGEKRETLLGDIEGRECITEYLGLTSWSEGRLEKHRDSDEVKEYDRELRGYAAVDEYYGYETMDGFEETGSTRVDSPQDRLVSIVNELDTREVEPNNEVPEEIKGRLEDLGYA